MIRAAVFAIRVTAAIASIGPAYAGGIGSYTAPGLTREDAGEILSHGRIQSRQTDINLSPAPDIRAPIAPLSTHANPWWHAYPLVPSTSDYAHGKLRVHTT